MSTQPKESKSPVVLVVFDHQVLYDPSLVTHRISMLNPR
jgi:hypothetical protein